jgi:type I restriction enzyme S subunit
MAGVEKLITEHIDVWTSAIKKRNATGRGSNKKIELIGIKKLRELILELAVRGKLVPQDASDEPASVLLEKIAEEKAQLIEDKKIKKKKPLPAITDEEKPFELPTGWEWISFGDICEIERGGSPRPIKAFITDAPEGLNWIKIGDTDIGGKYITSTSEKIIKEGLKKTREVYPGDFLLTNSMSFGRPYITKIKGCIHDGWLRISPPKSLDKDYLYNLLSSPFIISAFKKSASGAVVMNLNAEKVRAVTIAVPPINEQHRIVAKVDELMALCDQLEQQTEQSLSAHQTLVEVLLASLTSEASADGDSKEDFQTSWQRIAEHFDVLFTTEASIEQLKQTILQLAVMGKLVPQNPNDEPASVLLEKIAKEKAQLIADQKIKKQKPLDDITEIDEENLPISWSVAYMQDITKVVTCGMASTPKYHDEGRIFLSAKNVKPYKFMPEDHKFVDEETYRKITKNSKPEKGDILLTRVGAGIGEAAVVDTDIEFAFYVSLTLIKPFHEQLYSYFLLLWLNSPQGTKKSIDNIYGRGVSAGNLNVNQVRRFTVPIPPLAEQHRIVAKVDELMALCEQLKARLRDAQTTQLHLADAVVENALT